MTVPITRGTRCQRYLNHGKLQISRRQQFCYRKTQTSHVKEIAYIPLQENIYHTTVFVTGK
ncbi:MAG: hypothetical protein P8019_00695 [Gammaproteobacteria bacterium]